MSTLLKNLNQAKNQMATAGVNSQTTKSVINLVEFKKKFGSLAQRLEQEYKVNISVYKQKYYELSSGLNELYCDLRKYNGDLHALSLNLKQNDTSTFDKQNQDLNFQQNENQGQGQLHHQPNKQHLRKSMKSQNKRRRIDVDLQIDPLLILGYFRDFCHGMVQICMSCKQKQNKIKEDIGKLFSAQSQLHYLEVLAQKNLQNYDLALKTEELQNMLSQRVAQARLAERTTQQYQKKFKEQERDFNEITISIANMLKQCELSEIELRQENRLQKQLIQTHKIEFELYKSDFKMKPTYEQKANRIRQVLQKKFLDRQAIIIKQSQRMVENKFKGSSCSKPIDSRCSNKF